MKHILATILAGTLLLTGCANVVSTATSEYYLESCTKAEQGARMINVDTACTLAVINVDWSKQEPELKSERFYSLGRIKRQLYKFSDAIFLFKESLAVEEGMSNPSNLKIGYRLVELSLSFAGQNKWDEGMLYLHRALPVVSRFAGEERKLAAKALEIYSVHFRKLYQADIAKQFENAAAALY